MENDLGLPVGDVTSDERGSGARYNTGKAPLQWLPWETVANSLLLTPISHEQGYVRDALRWLGDFQRGNDYALSHLLIASANAARMSVNDVLTETARVLDFGAKKYASWNWAKGMAWSVPIACIGRHLYGWPDNPGMWHNARQVDRDSGLLHVGHVGANVMFLLEYMTTYREGDDRPVQLRRPV